jgi:hypothetical protein
MKKKFYITGACIFMLLCTANAQVKYAKSNYRKHPEWIRMMKDTSANYFETIKAFREYFKDRVLPKEANELKGSDSFETEVGLEEMGAGHESEREREHEKRMRNPQEPDYSAEVRAFKGWFYSIQPWVREDGSIIGPVEQQAIINKQHLELKAIEKSNGK